MLHRLPGTHCDAWNRGTISLEVPIGSTIIDSKNIGQLALSWRSGEQGVPFGPRALALYAFGQSLLRRGKTERAEAVARETMERAQRSGDHCGICSALAILGQIAQRSGNLAEAATFLVESDEHARLGGFPDLRSFTLRNLAELARMQGDLARATTLYEEALAVARAMGMRFGGA